VSGAKAKPRVGQLRGEVEAKVGKLIRVKSREIRSRDMLHEFYLVPYRILPRGKRPR
jgi:hypothetical protein